MYARFVCVAPKPELTGLFLSKKRRRTLFFVGSTGMSKHILGKNRFWRCLFQLFFSPTIIPPLLFLLLSFFLFFFILMGFGRTIWYGSGRNGARRRYSMGFQMIFMLFSVFLLMYTLANNGDITVIHGFWCVTTGVWQGVCLR